MWDCLLRKVDNQESLDHVPIFNVLLPLLDLHGHLVDQVLLLRLLFEHRLDLKLAVLELLEGGPVRVEHRLALCFAAVARLLLADGVHQRIQIHHFALNPVSDVLERVNHLAGVGVELVLQVRLGVTRDQPNVVFICCLCVANLILLGFFVLVQEVCELLVVSELLLFHWNNLLNVVFEFLQMVH